MIEITWVVPSFIMVFASMFPGAVDAVLARHVSPEVHLESVESPGSYGASQAVFSALLRLGEMGGEDMIVVGVRRIEAPLSGYLVDAAGILTMDCVEYTVFRVGVRDGMDDPDCAGEEFVFLAGGRDCDDNPIIFPPFLEDGGFVMEHEFLGDMDEFLGIGGPGGAETP